jgi:hypothetical protein
MDIIKERFGIEFEAATARMVDKLFAAAVAAGDAETPVIGGRLDSSALPEVKAQVLRALAALEWHERGPAPRWSKPLPLREEEFGSLMRAECNALQLAGYFGRSLRWNGWDYARYPPFGVFCSGVMEWILGPAELQEDRELQKMFPPRALPGLVNPLHWRPRRAA